jgi:nitric oxide dioxygenase
VERDLDLLESSWRRAASDGAAFAARFYDALFARHPELKSLFKRPRSTVERHFLAGLEVTIRSLRSPEQMSEHLEALAGAHLGYGVRPHHYPHFIETLLAVLEAGCGDAWSEPVERAWRRAFEQIEETIVRSLGEISATRGAQAAAPVPRGEPGAGASEKRTRGARRSGAGATPPDPKRGSEGIPAIAPPAPLVSDAEVGKPPPAVSPRAGSSALSVMARAIRDPGTTAMVALFRHDPERDAYVLHASSGVPAAVVEKVRSKLVFRRGEARGLVGLVAASGKTLYVPDCSADPRWVGRGRTLRIGSAFFLPIATGEDSGGVLCLLSANRDAFSQTTREVLALLVHMAEAAMDSAFAFEAQVGRLEQGLRRITAELLNLGMWVEERGGDLTPHALEGLRDLSQREWEILRCVAGGQRVATIARSLFLSPHTVRNHLKSIYRKLGVRTQGELRELIGRIQLPPPDKAP